ncbi:phytoene desaturase family protein [Cytobacillus spongiae]|uniref:phytoene desaturase family protein n=1 Tax=Cytobacillus spongiae TaxID=2901381 RepID=UPI001F42C379|nr:phytoene desaturase family protein [Cytobacillus spongiae]UII55491.1 phytoene desaturase family protein [Cytobacillus spongiae]
MKKVAIIGGGLGGLSAAITLANAGFDVEVFEKNGHLGGKLMQVQLNDYSFDFGPNTITMPSVFKKVIEQTGETAADYFELVKLDSHTRNFFPDGTSFDFISNQTDMLDQLKQLDPIGASQYEAFIHEITRLHELSEKYFLHRTFQSWRDYASPTLGAALLQVRPLETLDHFFRSYFSNENVVQAYNRYATYIGSSPYQAPATFAMIAYLEMVEGVYYVKGGNVKIAEAFTALAQKLGVKLHLETRVAKITVDNKQAQEIVLESGEAVSADHIIMNADLLQAFPELVDEEHRPSLSNKKVSQLEPSVSAYVILAGLNKQISDLQHHNVFFSKDYVGEFTTLFNQQQYAKEPTVYVCNSSFTDSNRSPKGDNLFILVNAPALTWNGELQIDPLLYKKTVFNQLRQFGVDIEPFIEVEKIITPKEIAEQFGAYRGALYGLSANKKKDAFLRPRNKSKDIHNLYFVGGSTHPGGGSPMVTLSGMNVARELIHLHNE